MILNDSEVNNRLNSVQNLSNKLRSLNDKAEVVAPDIVTGHQVIDFPFQSQITKTLIQNPSRSEIKEAIPEDDLADFAADLQRKAETKSANGKAVTVLGEALDLLRGQLQTSEITPVNLSRIAKDMGVVINNTNVDKQENHSGNNVIIYKPVMVSESHYQQVSVHE